MPLPPPPAEAFIIIGYPISFAMLKSFFSSFGILFLNPGTIGIPAFSASFLADILSPIFLITSGDGPINLKPLASHFSANSKFSAKNP